MISLRTISRFLRIGQNDDVGHKSSLIKFMAKELIEVKMCYLFCIADVVVIVSFIYCIGHIQL